MNLLVSLSIIVGTFSMSTISAFLICYFNNYPFINPQFTTKEKEMRLNEHIRNVPMLLFQSTTFMYVVSDNIIPYGQHTWLESCYSIASYCFLIEAVYYVYHRFIHKYYYAEIHKKHHKTLLYILLILFF
jgi:sterol desaturase/sphingolipid hydroxylase (fatty acid hydroxylase superfamily)